MHGYGTSRAWQRAFQVGVGAWVALCSGCFGGPAAIDYVIMKAMDDATIAQAREHNTHRAVSMTVSRGSARGVFAEVHYECGRTSKKFLAWPKEFRGSRVRYAGEHTSRDATPPRAPAPGEVVFGHLVDAPQIDLLDPDDDGGWRWRPLSRPLREQVRMSYLR